MSYPDFIKEALTQKAFTRGEAREATTSLPSAGGLPCWFLDAVSRKTFPAQAVVMQETPPVTPNLFNPTEM